MIQVTEAGLDPTTFAGGHSPSGTTTIPPASASTTHPAASHTWSPPLVRSVPLTQTSEHQAGALKNIEHTVALLMEAQLALRKGLIDAQATEKAFPLKVADAPGVALSRRIFVAHGHDNGACETVARFLEKIGFEPIILQEQASQNRTVIEKIEAYHDVGFAIVLLTPDDEGCAKGGKFEPRARQNVLLELGYFMGRLGRDKVCALRRGEVEIPSDFAGVIWVAMDVGNGWKQALGKELHAAGHAIDWNLVMRQ